MKKVGLLLLLVLSLTMTTQRGVNAEMSIYLDNAGYLISYTLASGDSLGVRGKIEKDFSYYGINFRNRIEKLCSKNLKIYLGLEGDYISSFKGIHSSGKGAIVYLPVGGIVSLWRINVSLEIGPGFLLLKDKSTGMKTSGFDPAIYNIGVGFRF